MILWPFVILSWCLDVTSEAAFWPANFEHLTYSWLPHLHWPLRSCIVCLIADGWLVSATWALLWFDFFIGIGMFISTFGSQPGDLRRPLRFISA